MTTTATEALQNLSPRVQRALSFLASSPHSLRPEIYTAELIIGMLLAYDVNPDADNIAAAALFEGGVSVAGLRATLIDRLGFTDAVISAYRPYSRNTRKAMELAYVNVVAEGRSQVEPEDVLLALNELEGYTTAAQMLAICKHAPLDECRHLLEDVCASIRRMAAERKNASAMK
jgi:hypothetical protein